MSEGFKPSIEWTSREYHCARSTLCRGEMEQVSNAGWGATVDVDGSQMDMLAMLAGPAIFGRDPKKNEHISTNLIDEPLFAGLARAVPRLFGDCPALPSITMHPNSSCDPGEHKCDTCGYVVDQME